MSLLKIPAWEYHENPALGSTSLKQALITPSHYWGFAKENPKRFIKKETEAMIFGRVAHCLVLEGEQEFMRDFAVLPDDTERRSNIGKANFAAFTAQAGKRTVVTTEQVEKARAMREVLSQHWSWQYLKHGVSEGSFFWTEDGLDCKVRLDWVNSDDYGDIIIDYKTTMCAAKDAFSRQMYNLNYHVQTDHYKCGFKAAYGREAKAFLFIAQDKEPPYAVGAYMIDPQAVANGRIRRLKAMDIIRKGRETGYWPGYTEKIEMIDLPTYGQYKAVEEQEQYEQEQKDHD